MGRVNFGVHGCIVCTCTRPYWWVWLRATYNYKWVKTQESCPEAAQDDVSVPLTLSLHTRLHDFRASYIYTWNERHTITSESRLTRQYLSDNSTCQIIISESRLTRQYLSDMESVGSYVCVYIYIHAFIYIRTLDNTNKCYYSTLWYLWLKYCAFKPSVAM